MARSHASTHSLKFPPKPSLGQSPGWPSFHRTSPGRRRPPRSVTGCDASVQEMSCSCSIMQDVCIHNGIQMPLLNRCCIKQCCFLKLPACLFLLFCCLLLSNKSYGIALEQLKKKIGLGSRRKSWQTQSHFKYRSKTFATNFNVIILHTTCLTPISHADVDHSQGFQSSAFSPPAVELPLALQELPAKESVLQFDGQAHVFVKN